MFPLLESQKFQGFVGNTDIVVLSVVLKVNVPARDALEHPGYMDLCPPLHCIVPGLSSRLNKMGLGHFLSRNF